VPHKSGRIFQPNQRHVPADAYYGIHTLRAIENFNISNVTISDVPEFVRGMVMTKKAAALANKELGAWTDGQRKRPIRVHQPERPR